MRSSVSTEGKLEETNMLGGQTMASVMVLLIGIAVVLPHVESAAVATSHR